MDFLADVEAIALHVPVTHPAKPDLSEHELVAISKKKRAFLQKVFPFLGKGKKADRINHAIELRALRRSETVDNRGTTGMYKNTNLYNLNEKSFYAINSFTRECSRAKTQNCQYYVNMSFEREVIFRKNKENKTVVCNAPQLARKTNAAALQTITLDFDNISKEDFIPHYYRLRMLGLKPIVIFTGNGYQLTFLLKEVWQDGDVLEDFARTAFFLGFPVDLSACKTPQNFRMPYSYNSKLYDPKKNKKGLEPHVVETLILVDSDERYSLDELYLKISEGEVTRERSLEFRAERLHKLEKTAKPLKTPKNASESKGEKKVEVKEPVEIKKPQKSSKKTPAEVGFMDINLRELYPMISESDFEHLSLGVQNIMKGPMVNLANVGLKFIVAHFKACGYNLGEVQEITSVWQGLDTFDYAWEDSVFVEKETQRFYSKNYPVSGHDVLTLEAHYGEIGADVSYYTIRDKVSFNNSTLKGLKAFTPTSFILYIWMKAEFFRTEQSVFSKQELMTGIQKNEKTVRANVNVLIELGIVAEKEVRKDSNRATIYFELLDVSVKELSFTKIDVSKIDSLIFRTYHPVLHERLTHRAVMLAIYLRYRTFGSRTTCFMSQETIARELGVTRVTINKAISELESINLIKKRKIKTEGAKFTKNEYILMY